MVHSGDRRGNGFHCNCCGPSWAGILISVSFVAPIILGAKVRTCLESQFVEG